MVANGPSYPSSYFCMFGLGWFIGPITILGGSGVKIAPNVFLLVFFVARAAPEDDTRMALVSRAAPEDDTRMALGWH